MTLTDFGPSSSTHSPIDVAFRTVARWVSTRRAGRAQEAALQSLLFAPERRLRDIGITREQLIQAMETHRR